MRLGLSLARVLAERLLKLNEKVLDLIMVAEGSEPLRERFSAARQEIFALWDYD